MIEGGIEEIMWTVIFYEKENGENQVKEFLDSLPAKLKAKALFEIDLLEQYGIDLREPYTKALQGGNYRGLWELRIKLGSDASRIFYFLPIRNTFVLLHGFLKKSEETPKREMEIAYRRMEDYRRRYL